MFHRLVLVAALSLLSGGPVFQYAHAAPVTLKKGAAPNFTSKGEKFSAWFPAKPAQGVAAQGAQAMGMTIRSFQATTPQGIFIILSGALPGRLDAAGQSAFLSGASAAFVRSSQGKLIKKQSIRAVNGVPGVEMWLTIAGKAGRVRIFCNATRHAQVMAIGNKGQIENSATTLKFLNSFRMN